MVNYKNYFDQVLTINPEINASKLPFVFHILQAILHIKLPAGLLP